jgi:putative ABC transport system permease protein
MRTLTQDLKYGLRMLAKNPGFTAVAVLTLALGIGANTAIFSVVNPLLLRPLPFGHPGRLMLLNETTERQPRVSVAYPNFVDWKQQNQVFEQMAAFQPADFTLTGLDQPEQIRGANVSANLLTTLEVKPAWGRDFVPDDDRPEAAPVAVVSYVFWQQRFGGRRDLAGTLLTLNGKSYAVVGVLPREFRTPDRADVLAAIGLEAKLMERGSHDNTYVIARLKPGVQLDQARMQMNTIAQRLEKEYPITNTGYRVSVTPIVEEFVGEVRPALLVLFGATGFVLLIACANVAGLLLSRAVNRRKEIAVRSALGAGRWRVARQLLTESVLLGCLAGILSLAFGVWGVNAIRAAMPEEMMQGVEVGMDRWVLGFTFLISLFTGVLFGLAPALHAARSGVTEALKETGRASTMSGSSRFLRSLFVVAEVSLSLVLLIGAGLLIRSLHNLLNVNPGFRPQNVLAVELLLNSPQFSDSSRVKSFCGQVLERVQSLPGVKSAAIGTTLPLTDDHDRGDIYIQGTPVPAYGNFPHPDFHYVSSGYVRTMGIQLVRGRDLMESDDQRAPEVALISATTARHFWPSQDPIGKRFMLGHPVKDGPWITVVGIVGDTKQYGLAAATRTEVYLSYLQHSNREVSLVLRSASNPETLTASIRKEVSAVDKQQPVSEVKTMEQVVSNSLHTQRVATGLLALFATLAMLLAAVGIYGVMAYSVSQRTHEIGIRMALGAERGDVLRLVVGHGMVLTLIGMAIGLAGAFGATRVLSSLLFGVRPTDLVTFAGVSALLAAVALLASYIPARRATKVDPMVALRYE